jgi:peptide-methionine (R)-S-oxide reductase
MEPTMTTRRRLMFTSATAAAAAVLGRAFANAASPGAAAFEITKSPEDWKKVLSKEQFDVLRDHGTERAGTSPLDKIYTPGTYSCAGCDLPLFTSQTKYDSGTGWPSFHTPIENAIGTSVDKSLWATRTEVHCRRCGGHLGHVFPDGPKPTGLRYCMNGVALKFAPKSSS